LRRFHSHFGRTMKTMREARTVIMSDEVPQSVKAKACEKFKFFLKSGRFTTNT